MPAIERLVCRVKRSLPLEADAPVARVTRTGCVPVFAQPVPGVERSRYVPAVRSVIVKEPSAVDVAVGSPAVNDPLLFRSR